ncbi:uncharacterized protein LOC117891281 [Drosophila subobscura]|uniref:uncharacterized protein LOC117891281 n=1 Tax=Drosophila subobscura TaxID=7241 RepID=UPI00155A3A83|nr:uncharacterized protein LOC117891281 [Drosophila subobscura]
MEYLPDCDLISIFSLLDLQSQLNVARVHSRFYALMPLVWGSKVRLSLFELNISSADLRRCLCIIRRTLQVLRFNMISRENFDILTSYVYPNAHDFRFSISSFGLQDADILMIIKAFPQLRTFSPVGQLTGKYFADIPHLENLNATHCSNFQGSSLVHIMHTSYLKTLHLNVPFWDNDILVVKLPTAGMRHLEVLLCNETEFSTLFMDNLKHLKRLKQLTILGMEDPKTQLELAEKLRAEGRHSLKRLEVQYACDVYFHGERLQLDVETFVMKYVNNLSAKMGRILHPFRHIKRLLFYSCLIEDADSFGRFLQLCQHVEIIEFEDCRFGFQCYTFSAQRIAKHRSTILQLYLQGSRFVRNNEDVAPMAWSVEGEDRLFKLHQTKSKINHIAHNKMLFTYYASQYYYCFDFNDIP